MGCVAVSDPWRDPVRWRDWWCDPGSPVRVTVRFDEAWHLLPGQRDRRWVATVWSREDNRLGHPTEFFELESWEPGFNSTSPVRCLYLFASYRFAEKGDAVAWGIAACERLCEYRQKAQAAKNDDLETVLVWSCEDRKVVEEWARPVERSRF